MVVVVLLLPHTPTVTIPTWLEARGQRFLILLPLLLLLLLLPLLLLRFLLPLPTTTFIT